MIWQCATLLLLFPLLFSFRLAPGQNSERFDANSYPRRSFHVSREEYRIGKFVIQMIQAKRVYDASSPPPSYCRAWLNVIENGKILRQAYFGDIDPVGSNFGIFLPEYQPLSDYFLALKEGDYDGRLLLVGDDGSLTNLPGGTFFLTPDKKFIIGAHSSDYESLFVIDLARRRIVINGAKERLPGIDEWYMDKNGYLFTAQDDSGMPQDPNLKTFVIYRLDLKNLTVKKGMIPAAQLKSIRKVELIQLKKTPDCTSTP